MFRKVTSSESKIIELMMNSPLLSHFDGFVVYFNQLQLTLYYYQILWKQL